MLRESPRVFVECQRIKLGHRTNVEKCGKLYFFSRFSLIFNDFVDQGGKEFYRIQTLFRVFRKDECTQETEGSTGPSRGEHRLTVYRAHASLTSISILKCTLSPGCSTC